MVCSLYLPKPVNSNHEEIQALGTAERSFLASRLEKLDREGGESGATIEDIQGAAGAIYTAGAETVSEDQIVTSTTALTISMKDFNDAVYLLFGNGSPSRTPGQSSGRNRFCYWYRPPSRI